MRLEDCEGVAGTSAAGCSTQSSAAESAEISRKIGGRKSSRRNAVVHQQQMRESPQIADSSCSAAESEVGDNVIVSDSAEIRPSNVRRHQNHPRFSVGRPSSICLFAAVVVFASLLSLTAGQDGMPDLSRIPTPPTFVHQPNDDKLYFLLQHSGHRNGHVGMSLKEREFRCQANAYPDVTYRWLKDGVLFNLSDADDRIRTYPNEGTFSFSNLREEDAGVYQCIAENGNGTALDKPIHFISAWLRRFKVEEPKTADVGLGDSLVMKCDPPGSDPPANVYWIYKSSSNTGSGSTDFSTINSTHISSDQEGNLYFHYVNQDNVHAEKYFTCTAENKQLEDYKFGNQFNINLLTGNGHRKKMSVIPPTELHVSPRRTTAIVGKTHRLDCFFSGYPLMDVRWFKDNVEIMGKDAAYLMPNFGRSVQIVNVSDTSAGKYECRFENPKLNREFVVRVEAAPYFPMGPPPSVNASEGMDVEFECGAVGNPDPKFTFYKNGKPIVDFSAGLTVIQNKLHVKNVQKKDARRSQDGDNAVYQCKAENKHGSIWVNFYLNILSFKPILLDHVPTRDVVAGQDVSLRCKFFASPHPMVTWIQPSSAGSSLKPPKEMTDPSGVSTFVIRDVKQHHSGQYRCHALNKEGETTGNIQLNVLETTRLLRRPKDQTIVAGQTLRLECEAQTDPELMATYSWLMDDKPLDQGKLSDGAYRITDDHALVIREPQAEDTGKFTCVARTRLDSTDQSAKIVVKDVPPPPTPTTVTCSADKRTAEVSFFLTQYMDVASPVQEVWVQYQIDDDADYNAWRTWEQPARGPWQPPQVSYDRISNMSTTRLHVKIRLRPWGKYRFRIISRNDVGDSAPAVFDPTTDFCITPAARPEISPQAVRAQGTTGDNLVVHWDPMPRDTWNGPDFGYIVKYRPEGEDDWQEAEVNDPTQGMYVVDDVPTYEPYEVQVQSKNAEGESIAQPETVEGFSGEGVPDVMVGGFRMIKPALSGTAATFEWNPIDAARLNGEFKGFKIIHWQDNSPDPANPQPSFRRKRSAPVRKEAVFDATASRGTVVGLKPNKLNWATIAVFNNAHDGPEAEPIQVLMPEGSPDPVESLNAFGLNSTEVGLLWKPPRETNGELKGYDVEICEVDESTNEVREGTCQTTHIDDPDADHYRAKGLQPNQKYRMKVQARSGAPDAGAPNHFFAKTLPLDINKNHQPINPNVTADDIGRNYFSAVWLPGNFNTSSRSPVGDTGYFKYREVGNSDDWTVAHPLSEDGFRATVRGLEPGTEYEVVSVAVHTAPDGKKLQAESAPVYVKTQGTRRGMMSFWWLILILAIICLLIIILCIVCVVSRTRGAKYIVTEKEKEQGREPMLGSDEKGFGEYDKDNDEKRSLTSKLDSETGSMDEYGEGGNLGYFHEDGSFIEKYAPGKLIASEAAADDASKSKVSTFV